jgi:hypothetical protein
LIGWPSSSNAFYRTRPEALRVYERAYAYGVQVEEEGKPPVTFSTVLAALLVGEDETSRWFAQEAESNGPSAIDVFKKKEEELKVRNASLAVPLSQFARQLAPVPGKPQPTRLSKDRHLLTVSARTVLENAERWAQGVGAGDIGVRHIVAAYVLNPPPAHREQMQGWKFQETKWRPVFFKWAAQRYTAEQWTDASLRPAPTKTFADLEQQQVKVKGSALAFPGDENTLKVLENAARYHARTKDFWLALHTVFCALVETARTDATVQEQVSPIWKAITASEIYEKTRDSILVRPPATKPVPGFADLDISPRVLNALETARELALTTRSDADTDFNVGVLALAGALLANRVEGDSDLATFGVDPQTLRLELLQHAQERAESSEVWREALGEEQSLRVGRAVDLSSDEPEAVIRLDEAWINDPLAIRGDVETFAALLASSSLEPPLSIGLFGPWGSGKTTFLKRLERAVRLRAADAQKASESGAQTPYVSNIVHVDFNAWHFSEGALTPAWSIGFCVS